MAEPQASETPAPRVGSVCTFYSFKGGVGRSMAVANVAALLAKWGYSVLVVDFDLEAPGIEHFFKRYSLQGSPEDVPGIVDLVSAYRDGQPLKWEACLCRAYPFPPNSGAQPVSILTAGKRTARPQGSQPRDSGYLGKLQALDWRMLFLEHRLGDYLETLREEWVQAFDFVLLDSRTGYTDVGGMCTIQLPDFLVVVLTTTDQGLAGTLDVINDTIQSREAMPLDRGTLYVVPVPSRVESWTEYTAAREWHNKFQDKLGPFIEQWLPRADVTKKQVTTREVLDQLTLPHVAYWSFGEGLPVVEEGSEGKLSLGRAYAFLAGLIRHRLDYAAIGVEVSTTPLDRGTKSVVESAEGAFRALSEEEHRLAEAAFARMVHYPNDPELPPVVESLPLSEFAHLRPVIEKLAAAQVIVVKNETAYLTDEVLLKSWGRLREASTERLRDALDGLGRLRRGEWLVAALRNWQGARVLLETYPHAISSTERKLLRRFEVIRTGMRVVSIIYGLGFLVVAGYWLWQGVRELIEWVASRANPL